jgi:DNA recombination protein RmuC
MGKIFPMTVPLSYLILAVAVTSLIFMFVLLLVRRFDRSGTLNKEQLNPIQALDQIARQLEKIERIESGVNNLSQIFLLPRTRGGIGEKLLEELLKDWLPEKSYEFQYSFSGGQRVDAVIRLAAYLVPVDAKFPMESIRSIFDPGGDSDTDSGTIIDINSGQDSGSKALPGEIRRALERHIDSTAQYIRPSEGTLQFALMYIPSESIYYELFVRDTGLLETAVHRGVVPVSPSNLFLYLQTVVYGLRGLSFPKKQRELTKSIYQLRKDFSALEKQLQLMGTHAKNTWKAYEETVSRLQRVEFLIQRFEKLESDEEQ